LQQGSVKARLYALLEESRDGDPAGLLVDRVLIALIIANVVFAVLETVPAIRQSYGTFLSFLQLGSGIIFLLEYCLRLYVADLHPPLRKFGSMGARIRYSVQPSAVVDLLAALPFLLVFVLPNNAITTVVVLRLLRFLKLARYSPALRSLVSAIAAESRALVGSLVIIWGVILLAATLMYLVEADIQPDVFGSIPHAMWWAIATVTTVGYGDVVPISTIGKVLGGVVMLMGYALLALPVGIIASAFAREIHSRDFVVTWSMVARVPLFDELTASEIAEVAKLLRAQKAVAGERIVIRGEAANSMFFIADGEVEIDLPNEKVFVGEGGFFGEMALLMERTRAADVIATMDCQLLVLETESLKRLMERNPDLAKRLLQEAEQRAAVGWKAVGDLAEEELTQPEATEEPVAEASSEPELFDTEDQKFGQ